MILLALLASFLTPLQDLIGQAATAFEASPANPVPPAVRLFLLGLVCALVLQFSTKALITAVWHRMKG